MLAAQLHCAAANEFCGAAFVRHAERPACISIRTRIIVIGGEWLPPVSREEFFNFLAALGGNLGWCLCWHIIAVRVSLDPVADTENYNWLL